MSIKNIEIGYACQNTYLREAGVFCSRTIREDALLEMGETEAVKKLKDLSLQNLRDMLTIMGWNREHGIRFFRMSSDLFPHIGNPLFQTQWRSSYFKGNLKFAEPLLKVIGDTARRHVARLDFHSTPYCQMASPNEETFKKTLFDLQVTYNCLKALGIQDYPGVIYHIGGYYGDKEATLARWAERYRALPKHLQRIIMVENDEHYYFAERVLTFCEQEKIPMVFDFFHNTASLPEYQIVVTEKFLDRVCATWQDSGDEPKFHLSEQDDDKNRGAHSDLVGTIPCELLAYAAQYPANTYWLMIEAKLKEQAAMGLLTQYAEL